MPRVQHKRGTSTNLTAANPTPLAGELVWDSTENAIKIGTGSTAWTSLAYVTATPRSHKSTHATGGSDALTPSDIGAAPATSPAITGNATFSASAGVPVTITNTGTGNSFVVNDEASDASPFVIGSSGLVGIGVEPTSRRLTVRGSSTGDGAVLLQSSSTGTGASNGFIIQCFGASSDAYVWNFENAPIIFGANNAERMRLYADGKLDVTNSVWAVNGSAGSPGFTFRNDTNTGIFQASGSADTLSISTAGVERVRVDSVGRVRIYQTASDGTGVGRCEFMSHGGTTVSGGFILYGASYASGIYMGLGVSSLHLYNSGGHCSLSTTTAHDVVLGSNSLSRFRVKSTGAVRFVPLSADPASGEAGDVYYNSSTNKLRVYDGTSWVDLH